MQTSTAQCRPLQCISTSSFALARIIECFLSVDLVHTCLIKQTVGLTVVRGCRWIGLLRCGWRRLMARLMRLVRPPTLWTRRWPRPATVPTTTLRGWSGAAHSLPPFSSMLYPCPPSLSSNYSSPALHLVISKLLDLGLFPWRDPSPSEGISPADRGLTYSWISTILRAFLPSLCDIVCFHSHKTAAVAEALCVHLPVCHSPVP